MPILSILSPTRLRKVVLWPVIEHSSRIAAPLVPSRTLRGLLHHVGDYAAGTITLWGDKISVDEEEVWTQLLHNATTLEEYQTAAGNLDRIQGHDLWKEERYSTELEYDPDIIETQLQELAYARYTSDLSAMRHLIRTNLSRELGGMNMLSLYKHSWAGTKVLVDDYTSSVLDTIDKFAEAAIRFDLATDEVQFYQQSLADSLKYFGRSALTLSGGAIMGMKHIGVVKVLWEADILPEIISGSSAGSIVAAVVGASSDEEMKDIITSFPTSDLACFDPPGTGALGWASHRIKNFFRTGSFFSMSAMERVMKTWLGELTFREAYYKTHRTLNICVSSADSGEPRLLNYITSPDVLIWSAVCASCSVPNVFPSANIYEKDPSTKKIRLWMQHAKQLFVDGSLDHDIPMRKLSEMFNVNFFIVSQVNPHVRLFLDPEEEFHGRQAHSERASWWGMPHIFRTTKHLIRREVVQRAQQARNLGVADDLLRWASLFSQQYTGDINILPQIRPEEFTYMLANPSPKFMIQATIDGERATWPKIWRIKNCVAIELALIRAINTLRERVNFGPEARALREQNRRASRGRSFSIRGQRPEFLRRRSLSSGHSNGIGLGNMGHYMSAPITPGSPVATRRNRSLSTMSDTLGFSTITGPAQQVLALAQPQDGRPIFDLERDHEAVEEGSYFPPIGVSSIDTVMGQSMESLPSM